MSKYQRQRELKSTLKRYSKWGAEPRKEKYLNEVDFSSLQLNLWAASFGNLFQGHLDPARLKTRLKAKHSQKHAKTGVNLFITRAGGYYGHLQLLSEAAELNRQWYMNILKDKE